jgi:hypothetical protein
MPPYSQTARQTSWALLFVTLLLAGFVFLAIGFVSVVVGFIQHLMVPEKPWQFARAMWFAVGVLLPALWLARFYFVVAARAPSPRYAKVGWGISTVYHAGLTALFLFAMPGTIQATGSTPHLPLSLLSAAAFCASWYLFIRYPRSPRLPER